MSRAAFASEVDDDAIDIVAFSVGPHGFLVPRDQVWGIGRTAAALRAARDGRTTVLALATLLGQPAAEDASGRVLEVEHRGRRLSLVVTAISGVRQLSPEAMQPLPPLLARSCLSKAVLGLAWFEEGWWLAVDLAQLLAESEHLLPAEES